MSETDPQHRGQNSLPRERITATPGAVQRVPLPSGAGAPYRALLAIDSWFNRVFTANWNPLYKTGPLAMTFLLVTLVTGVYLFLLYKVSDPYGSVSRLDATWHGGWIRSIHRYAADLVVVAVAIHAIRMFLSGRSWGPRAMAWISGLISMAVLLMCGWTGLVMAWDVQGQLVALEGARLADLLPIFSEPITRSFTQPETIGRSFFFMNLFLHVALPLGIAVLYWLHISQVARAQFLPPRGLHYGAIAAVGILAIVVPVPLPPAADVLAVPVNVPLDLFYAFWLPLARSVTPLVHLLTWVGVAVVLFSVPWWWRPKTHTIETSVVDEEHCTGCAQCYLDCPYDAISMVASPVPSSHSELVARVNPDACTGCAICSGSCAPMVVGPAGRSGRDQLQAVKDFLNRHQPSADQVIVIPCGHGLGDRWQPPPGSDFLPLTSGCSGSVHTSAIEYLLRSGAGGVMLLTCPERDCLYREGPRWLNERVYRDREAELRTRVDKRRVKVAAFAPGEGAQARRAVAAFRAQLEELEPVVIEREISVERDCKVQYVEL